MKMRRSLVMAMYIRIHSSMNNTDNCDCISSGFEPVERVMDTCTFESCQSRQCRNTGCFNERYGRYLECNSCRKTKRAYGMTAPERNSILASQGGVCLICGHSIEFTNSPAKMNSAHVDHCHKTNTVRGILCGFCNILMGTIDNRKINPQRVVEYVSKRG
jgi:hypothetical protein